MVHESFGSESVSLSVVKGGGVLVLVLLRGKVLSPLMSVVWKGTIYMKM